MPSIRQLFKSMQFQLIFWSVLALLLLAVVAGGYGFWHSYEELNEFQDDNLKSMTAVLEQTLDIQTSGSSSLQNTNIHFDTDDDDGSITVDIINTDTSAPVVYSSIPLMIAITAMKATTMKRNTTKMILMTLQ